MNKTCISGGVLVAWCCFAGAVVLGEDPATAWRKQVEADWALQDAVRGPPGARGPVTAAEDAAGGCDGVKNGAWGFHTAEDEQPWWQVDLENLASIDRVVIFNRADGTASRAARLELLISEDKMIWREVYRHGGAVFRGAPDGKPLIVRLGGARARYVRVRLPGRMFLHLDEVEVYGPGSEAGNLALGRPCDQSSVSPWSSRKPRARRAGAGDDGALAKRWAARAAALASPLLDFEDILFVQRVPGSYSHMSDQNYGWWSRPGGGIFVLEGFKTAAPALRRLTPEMPPGSFSGPDLSGDRRKVLFSWCRYYPHVAGIQDKVDKESLPEDAFYHVFEMNADGTGLRQLTRGRTDDFDARYLPGGDIIFLSTRRGRTVQCAAPEETPAAGEASPDSFVRCGGGRYRPVAVYTLHRMGPGGESIRALSPFENFEWTPSIAADGRILYARWDYVDRDNMPYMGLWAMNPDGTGARAVYGNETVSPYSAFEARSVPGSAKFVFTASAHHSITGGSLVLLDPGRGGDGPGPLSRLTPDVCFPEVEGWPSNYFASPYPLSESLYLTAWSPVPLTREGGANPPNALGIYLFDAGSGRLELLHRDPEISSLHPLPLRPRREPPRLADDLPAAGEADGRVLLLDVYQGLAGIERGSVKALRIVAVPPKTQPEMNSPVLGVTRDDPGKFVLGTVPVEEDGSAHFRVPAGVPLFFQVLDSRGLAVQTMRSAASIPAGKTLSCVGCHEHAAMAPPNAPPLAGARPPSAIKAGPEGSWPLRFDCLVQPALDRHCAGCHRPDGPDAAAARFDLTAPASYESLVAFGEPSLRDQVLAAYRLGRSIPGAGGARASRLLGLLEREGGHHGARLDAESLDRLATWMDTYAQRLGSFSAEQEDELRLLRRKLAGRVIE